MGLFPLIIKHRLPDTSDEKYRIGGNLDLVFINLKRLIEMRKQLNSKTPVIEWQMIDFDFNKTEQKEAQKLSNQFGVDYFKIKPDCYSTYPSKVYSRQKKCVLLWFSFAVECDGLVSSCITMDDDSLFVGNLKKNTIKEIWNSKRYIDLRKNHNSDDTESNYFCKRCNRFDV